MREQLLVEQDPTKCLIGPELVRVFYACAKLATIQSNTYYAPRKAMNEMAWGVLPETLYYFCGSILGVLPDMA